MNFKLLLSDIKYFLELFKKDGFKEVKAYYGVYKANSLYKEYFK